jgi:hypothetical protein
MIGMAALSAATVQHAVVHPSMVCEAAAAFPGTGSVSFAGCGVVDGAVEALEHFGKLSSVDLSRTRGIRGERLPEILSVAPTLRQLHVRWRAFFCSLAADPWHSWLVCRCPTPHWPS